MTYRVGILLLSSTVIATACAGPKAASSSAATSPAVQVTVVRADLADVSTVFEAGGVVRAHHAATIASRVLATITSVHVSPGDYVQRGQAVIDLDARETNANRAHAVAASAAAENAVTASEADLAAANASLAQARSARDRVLVLFDKHSATPQERDDATASFALTEAHVAGAQARLAAARSSLEAAHAAVDAAGILASYTRLTAPFDGTVAARRADPGDTAAPGIGLLVIEESGTRQLEVTIDESRMPYVALHQEVRVRPDGADTMMAAPAAGRIVEIARVDSDSHSFVAKIELPATLALRTGQYGRAEFNGPSHKAIVVPSSAVVHRGQLALVFTMEANQARLRQVSPGMSTAAGTEITAGLTGGDLVIVSPSEALADGASVSVTGSRR